MCYKYEDIMAVLFLCFPFINFSQCKYVFSFVCPNDRRNDGIFTNFVNFFTKFYDSLGCFAFKL